MGKANPYIHIPKESWPNWTWYAIECVALIVIAFAASVKITNSIEGLTPELHNYIITGFFGSFFLVWYVVIRGLILKKKILK
jgi:bacteriorhodopsin